MNKLKISFLLFLMLGISLNSCNEKTIEVDPVGDTEPGFFQNESQMEQAVFGIYQKLAFFYAFRGGQNNYTAPVLLLPSDDLTTSEGYAHENFSGLNGGNGQLGLYYQFAYQLIARANTVLEKIEQNSATAYKLIPAQKDWHRGEALFLRAYMYFCLWNVFGTAPVVTQRITNLENAYPPSSKDTELLDQAISDLEEAAKILPASWANEFKGRVTKNSALGLRGKCLVFRGTVKKSAADFTAALADFNAISGLSLVSNYVNNFDVRFENNAESLFEYQASNSTGGVNPFVGTAGGNDAFSVIGEIGAYYGFYTQRPTWVGNSVFSATSSIVDAYENGDPRKGYNVIATPNTLLNVQKYVRVANTNWATGGNGKSNEISLNNPRILRYADVLLLKAEALVRSGGSLADAIAIVNQIRDRARKSVESGSPSAIPADRDVTETNAATVLEWIFQERRLELAFEEGHRWWDLRRRHIAGEIDLKTWNFYSKRNDFKFVDTNVNFPLPEKEVIESRGTLVQNPGY